uniref:Vesicle transport v-SNARE N-terminal domain-containing protein n=1 Tax=Zea mays TaxID=4577 RepID=A0A804QMV8_MAIZE
MVVVGGQEPGGVRAPRARLFIASTRSSVSTTSFIEGQLRGSPARQPSVKRKKQKLSEIHSDVEEAESLIWKMDLEARSLQPSIKAGLLAKLREYKSDLNNVKSELKRISAPNARQATREELLESGMADTLAVS